MGVSRTKSCCNWASIEWWDWREKGVYIYIVRVEDALKIQRLILGFKILNDLAPASFGSYIQHSRLVNTRLLHQASRTSSFFNSMFISLPRLWDEIPSDLHIVSNLSSFKVGCKSHYLSMLS